VGLPESDRTADAAQPVASRTVARAIDLTPATAQALRVVATDSEMMPPGPVWPGRGPPDSAWELPAARPVRTQPGGQAEQAQ
jgi:hypothetical protein